MSLAAVTQDDYAVIADLIEGIEVLQIGCHQGYDTMTLARGAARVIAIGQRDGLPVGAFRDPFEQWHQIQRFYGTAARTLLLADPVQVAMRAFVPGQFDVAVVDYSAWPAHPPFGLIPAAAHLAGRVIVLGMAGMDLTGEIAETVAYGCVCEQRGHLHILDHPVTAPDEASKEET